MAAWSGQKVVLEGRGRVFLEGRAAGALAGIRHCARARGSCAPAIQATHLQLTALPAIYTTSARRLPASSPIKAAAMSLDPPTYILSLQNNIRTRPISWEGAVRAKTITDQDLKKIKSIDKVRKEQRKHAIEQDSQSYVSLLLGSNDDQDVFQAAQKGKRQDIIQYMLVLAGDLVEGTFASASCSQFPEHMRICRC